jgi:hypothetical protein
MSTSTARQVITDAFHSMGFISEDEALTAEQASRGLRVMNQMMQGWPAEGIPYVHAALTLDTIVNVPDELVPSTTWMLVDELAMEYGKALTDRQQMQVDRARNSLQSNYYRVPPAQLDEGIRPNWPPGYWDISRG